MVLCCMPRVLCLQIDTQIKQSQFEAEIREEQEQKRKEEEEKKQKRAEFKDKAMFFCQPN